jgi:hypothetical protein
MAALRTNPTFADAANADAASLRICGDECSAMQRISPERSFSLVELGGIQTTHSLQPVLTI